MVARSPSAWYASSRRRGRRPYPEVFAVSRNVDTAVVGWVRRLLDSPVWGGLRPGDDRYPGDARLRGANLQTLGMAAGLVLLTIILIVVVIVTRFV